MFDYNVMLKMLVIPETRFASVVILLWELKEINHSFGDWCRMEFIWKQLEEGIICDTKSSMRFGGRTKSQPISDMIQTIIATSPIDSIIGKV